MRNRRWLCLLLIGLGLAGCRAETLPPNPTVIPSLTSTVLPLTLTASPTLSVSLAPSPTFRPMITATNGPTAVAVVADAPIAIPTLAPICFTAKANDTIVTLLSAGGYADLSAAPAFRQLNNLPPGSSTIQIGQKYCVPRPTSTPTPEGYELTQAAQRSILPTTGAMILTEYVVKEGDTPFAVELKTSVALSLICRLNPLPDGLNCAGCNLNAPIYGAGCRPTLRIGQHLKLPGPTPTPTITPTLTGSETPTAIPAYSAPVILSPVSGATVSGSARLSWMPASGTLKADEVYLVLMTDATVSGSPRNIQQTMQVTSWLLPPDYGPTDANPRTIYWQVGIARIGEDGIAILISEKSPAMAFTWVKP